MLTHRTTLLAAAVLVVACDTNDPASSSGNAPGDGTSDPADPPVPPPPASEPGRHAVTVVETRRIVPSDGLPPDIAIGGSNNNLDVIRFEGRVYLAWRTAPDHFASAKTRIEVVSSDDERTWRREHTFELGTDLREPRFLVHDGALVLHVSVLGKDASRFEPGGPRHARRASDGTWSSLTPVMRVDPGAGASPVAMTDDVVWRTKSERGRSYMTMYSGAEHIYTFDGRPLTVGFLTTDDGDAWHGVDPAQPVVFTGGGTESDFTIADDGTLYSVIRIEAADANGVGSRVCHAPAGDLTKWSCRLDPRKYDSPLAFWHDGEAYLVARRNVTATGNFDLGTPAESPTQTMLKYQIDYRGRPKRCAIWRFVPGEDRIAYITDLPSRGDTCFAAKIAGSARTSSSSTTTARTWTVPTSAGRRARSRRRTSTGTSSASIRAEPRPMHRPPS